MFLIYYIDYTILIDDVKYSYMFRFPLLMTLFYYLARYIFIKIFNREPRNTFWIWEYKGLLYDILFNLIFFLIAGTLFILIIAGVI